MAAINIFPIYDDSNDNIIDYRPVVPVVVENIPSILIDGVDIKSEYNVSLADGNYAKILQFPNSKGVQYNEWDEYSGLDVDFNRVLLAASKGIDLTFICPKSSSNSFGAFHNFMMSSATHTLSYFGRLSTDAFPPITLRFDSTKLNYVNEFFELATQHSVTYHFTVDVPWIPVNRETIYESSYSELSIVPYWENSDENYNGMSFYIGKSVNDLRKSSRFGVCLLQGTSLSVQGKPNLKNSFTYSSEFSIGQSVEALTTTAGYSITLNCLMRAPSLAIFWTNYRALLWELFRGMTELYNVADIDHPDPVISVFSHVLFPFWQFIRLDIGYKQTIQLKCYYESCSSKKFIIRQNGNLTPVFWQFSLTFKVYEPATFV